MSRPHGIACRVALGVVHAWYRTARLVVRSVRVREERHFDDAVKGRDPRGTGARIPTSRAYVRVRQERHVSDADGWLVPRVIGVTFSESRRRRGAPRRDWHFNPDGRTLVPER